MGAEKLFTILQLALINETGDSCYRMRWPARELSKRNPAWRVINLDARAEERYHWAEHADLLVVFHSNDVELIPILRARKRRGLKTIIEFGDNFYQAPAASPVARAWSSPLLWQAYERMMKEGDVMLVTSEALSKLFAGKSPKPPVIIENQLPEAPPPFEESWQPLDSEIRLGWAGSLGHMADILTYVPMIKRLLERFPKAMIHLMGNKAIPSTLGLPPERLRFFEWSNMADYMQFWKGIHIGLGLLLDTPYNRCRSDVKALEMSAMGCLPLLPVLPPYESFLRSSGLTGWRSGAELEERLQALLGAAPEIEAQARKAYAAISERNESRQSKRNELYKSLLPAQPQSVLNWPCEAGYHELSGTIEKENRRQVTIAEMEKCLKEKEQGKALEIIKPALNSQPDDPDLMLALITCLGKAGHPEVAETASRGSRLYPNDLRFDLILAQAASADDAAKLWAGLARKLDTGPAAMREFFAPPVLRRFGPAFRANPALIDTGLRLLRLYPSSLILLFELSGFYQRNDDSRKALEMLEKLHRIQQEQALVQACGAAFDRGYVETWIEALKGGAGRSS